MGWGGVGWGGVGWGVGGGGVGGDRGESGAFVRAVRPAGIWAAVSADKASPRPQM